MSKKSKAPWYYEPLMNRCKTEQGKEIVHFMVRHRKNLMMTLGFFFILGVFPRLTSVAWNEEVYFGSRRYQRRQEGELPVLELKKVDKEE